jgi:predicted small secreted protein
MISKIKGYISIIVIGIITVLLWLVRRQGINSERNKQTKEVLESVKEAKKTRNNITDSRLNKLFKKYNRG